MQSLTTKLTLNHFSLRTGEPFEDATTCWRSLFDVYPAQVVVSDVEHWLTTWRLAALTFRVYPLGRVLAVWHKSKNLDESIVSMMVQPDYRVVMQMATFAEPRAQDLNPDTPLNVVQFWRMRCITIAQAVGWYWIASDYRNDDSPVRSWVSINLRRVIDIDPVLDVPSRLLTTSVDLTDLTTYYRSVTF